MTSTVQVAGQSRHPTFHGEQVGTLEMNTLQNGDISGVQTINLQPYPPVIAPNPGGELPVGTVVGAYLMWNGTAWVQQVFPAGVLPTGGVTNSTLRWNGSEWVANSAFKVSSVGDLIVRRINARPCPVADALEGEVTTSQYLSLFDVVESNTTTSLLPLMRRHIHTIWRGVDLVSIDVTYRAQVRVTTAVSANCFSGWRIRIDLQKISDVIIGGLYGLPSIPSEWGAVTGIAMLETRNSNHLVIKDETQLTIIESEDDVFAVTRVPMVSAVYLNFGPGDVDRDYNVILTFKGYGVIAPIAA